MSESHVSGRASAVHIEAARQIYQYTRSDGDIEIDDDALLSDCEDGTYWVQAWVFVPGHDNLDDDAPCLCGAPIVDGECTDLDCELFKSATLDPDAPIPFVLA